MNKHRIYPLSKSPLYRLRNRKKLAKLLCVEQSYFYKPHNYTYQHFSKPKPNGEERHFANPPDRLKIIQKRINKLLQRIETPEWVKFGKKGESYLINGQYHMSSDYVRTMDISQFYDSVKRDAVYYLFSDRLKMADDIATMMTNLVLDGNTLPTGAPTSQLIAFWAYRDMFKEIYDIAEAASCKFTLYVDDMTFSSDDPIPYELREAVASCLHKYGLYAKRSKDHYYKKDDYKIVTGVGFKNGVASVPNKKKVDILAMYKSLKSSSDSVDVNRLSGKLFSARQVQPDLFSSFDIKHGG